MSVKPELSRAYAVERLSADGTRFTIEASEAERAALARRFDLVAVERLEASGTITAGRGTAPIEIEGRLRAAPVQRCVVTLEPVPAEIDIEFRRLFSQEPLASAQVEVDPEVEQPEPLEGSVLDLGEVVAEELAMALDPYPHAPGAEEALKEVAPGKPAEGGPFAALASLRRH